MERVLGVDACRAGWIGVATGDGPPKAYVAAQIGALVDLVEADGKVAVVAIDMPIGLPDRGRRQADMLAREHVGALRSSVFITPVRAAIEADDHHAAVAISRELSGEGVSIQAFGLRRKLLEVERWVRGTRHRVVEVHPEVSFAALAGESLTVRKSTWAGVERRRTLLATAGITLTGELGAAGRVVAVDDVLDAAAAAWTARRVGRGEAFRLPDPSERFSDGLECAIWV